LFKLGAERGGYQEKLAKKFHLMDGHLFLCGIK
jgi:hypothetical protein